MKQSSEGLGLGGQGSPPMNVFTFQEYRALLYHLVEERKLVEPSFTFQKLAAIAGVQRAYLSKVLSGQAQLNQDQLYLVAQFFAWSELEYNYVSLLLEIDRCTLAERKQVLLQKRAKLASTNAQDRELLDAYINSAIAPQLHQALRITRYRKNPELLEEEWRVSHQDLRQAFSLLQRLGFVQRGQEGQWELVQAELPAFLDTAQERAFRDRVKPQALAKLHEQVSFITLNKAQLEELKKRLVTMERNTAQERGSDLYGLRIELWKP